jgi:hypothetical protein
LNLTTEEDRQIGLVVAVGNRWRWLLTSMIEIGQVARRA